MDHKQWDGSSPLTNPNMKGSTGRRNRLSEPEFCEELATLYVSGLTYQDIADELDASRHSVAAWCKDPRVLVYITRLSKERILRITRKVDTELETRLQGVNTMKVEDLIKIRKEFTSRGNMGLEESKADEATTLNEVSEAIDKNPELGEALRAWAAGNG